MCGTKGWIDLRSGETEWLGGVFTLININKLNILTINYSSDDAASSPHLPTRQVLKIFKTEIYAQFLTHDPTVPLSLDFKTLARVHNIQIFCNHNDLKVR